jgi:predicted nuclease of predicted toxin-antitoxin system
MKFLADMGISMRTVSALRKNGHQVEHMSELGLIRAADRDIVTRARSNGQVVLTFDLDFGEIMALSRFASPTVILFRTKNQTPQAITPKLLQVIHECGPQLMRGAFVTVEDSGFRIRQLPIG